MTITRAEGDTGDMELRVEGTAPAGDSIFLHDGAATGDDCLGAGIGSASVDGGGDWEYRVDNQPFLPSTVCAEAQTDGSATSSTVDIN